LALSCLVCEYKINSILADVIFSSPEPKAQVGYSNHVQSVRKFPLNDFFSKTTELIWTKFYRKYLWGMGIQICEN